jgi:hypothetical protein
MEGHLKADDFGTDKFASKFSFQKNSETPNVYTVTGT